MFNWDVKELKLYKERRKSRDNDFVYSCEKEGVVSLEDKVDFVNSMQDGKLGTAIGYLIEINKPGQEFKRDAEGKIIISDLIKWLQNIDAKSGRVLSGNVFYYDFLREASVTKTDVGDVMEDMVDKAFHSQLNICYEKEVLYVLQDGAERLVQKATSNIVKGE